MVYALNMGTAKDGLQIPFNSVLSRLALVRVGIAPELAIFRGPEATVS